MAWTTSRRPRQRVLGPWDSRAPVRRGRHGLTAGEVDELIARQGGACAVCGRTDRPLQLDHDHGHCPGPRGCRLCIRGALCGVCNTVLGLLRDDLEVLRQLVRYLEPR